MQAARSSPSLLPLINSGQGRHTEGVITLRYGRQIIQDLKHRLIGHALFKRGKVGHLQECKQGCRVSATQKACITFPCLSK